LGPPTSTAARAAGLAATVVALVAVYWALFEVRLASVD
jgi:hypothetical protein